MIAASDMTKVQTFMALIRVAMGQETQLPHVPTDAQWEDLYMLAREQALIGVCFAGIQRLKRQGMCPPMPLYMQWLGEASRIQQRNEKMNQWSAELCEKIEADGYGCCVLKGQAVARLYSENLGKLRQPGDIDVWMLAPHKKVIQWGQRNSGIWFYDYHHADLMGFHDVEVELHYRPTLSRNLWRNTRLQRWMNTERENLISNGNGKANNTFPVPSTEFALILTLNHNFWHLLYEGVGMRQMMDLYFVLRGLTPNPSPRGEGNHGGEGSQYLYLIKHFGLTRFARASMWVMKEVFGLEDEFFVCEPDERSGRFLLNEILQAGNFGHADKRLKRGGGNRVVLMGRWLKHTWRLFRDYPADVLWTPIGVLYISLWRRWHYRFDYIKLNTKQ